MRLWLLVYSQSIKMSSRMENGNPVHVLIIPFPDAGHIKPLLELTRRLLTRHDNHLIATVVITPSSLSLLQPLLSAFTPTQLQPLILSPPSVPSSDNDIDDVPPPPTRTIRKLHTLSDPIISWCGTHPSPPCVIISDIFCAWTHNVCTYLNVPQIVFYSSGAFGSAVMHSIWRLAPENHDLDSDLEVVLEDMDGSPRFKWSEVSPLFRSGKRGDLDWDLFRADMLTNLASWGAVFNTFYEFEKVYIDHFKKEMGHNRVWAVGPLLQDDLAQNGGLEPQFQDVMTWLDGKVDCSVVYVCFGSRTSLTNKESKVLRAALEYSNVHFIWCEGVLDGREGLDIILVKNGMIIKGWAPQLAILRHRAVGGFVTHCGWNSIIESICSGVVMVCWPMGADQYSNAKLVVDQLDLGFRVKRYGLESVPDYRELAKLLVECVSLTRLERGRVISLGKVATSTVKSGGTAALDFDRFVECLSDCTI